jgi:hypothetical protein
MVFCRSVNRSTRILLGVAAALCLALAPAAGAERLGWKETAKVAGAPVMVYRVDSLTFGSASWSARVSMQNISKKTIKVGNSFGVAFWTDPKSEKLDAAFLFGRVSKYSTKLPSSLKPGASWSSVITGMGKPPTTRTLYARIIFGPFSPFPGHAGPVVWITDHAKKIGATSGQNVPGTVI